LRLAKAFTEVAAISEESWLLFFFLLFCFLVGIDIHSSSAGLSSTTSGGGETGSSCAESSA